MFGRSRALAAVLLSVLAAVLLTTGAELARAADYPMPTHGSGAVDRTTVTAGECVNFSGGGFAPGAPLTIKDNGRVVGRSSADSSGNFTYPVCFRTSASHGKHTLSAEGLGANGAARVVTSVVTVVGASVTISGSAGGGVSGPAGGGVSGTAGGGVGGAGLPFTGADIRNLVLLGSGLLLLGGVLVHRGHVGRRARRIGTRAA